MDLGAQPEHQKDQVEKEDQVGLQANLASFLATCDNAPSGSTGKRDFVQRMDQARLPADRFLFQEGRQPDRGGCRNVRRSVRIRGPNILGKDKKLVETDNTWEVAEGKQWKAAKFIPMGRGHGNGFWTTQSSPRPEPFLEPVPHPGGPREERLFDAFAGRPHRDQVVTSRPPS